MKELWIHSGLTKTGSSALQVFLAQNRDSLLAEGIDYIPLRNLNRAVSGKITSGNGQLFAQSLLDHGPDQIEDKHIHYNRLLEYLEKNDKTRYLVSSEFFQTISQKAYKGLKNDLEKIGVELHLLYYVRRQDQKLMAMYMQGVKRSGFTTLPGEDFVKRKLDDDFTLNYYDYTRNYEDILGEGHVHPFIYENAVKHEKGLAGHFTSVLLGYYPKWVSAMQTVNTSPNPLEMRFMLLANKYNPRMSFSDYLVESSFQAGRSAGFKKHQIFPKELSRRIIEHYSEQNTLFENKYGGGGTFPAFIPDEFEDISAVEFKDNIEQTVDIFAGMLVAYDKRLAELERKINSKRSLKRYGVKKLKIIGNVFAKLMNREKKNS